MKTGRETLKTNLEVTSTKFSFIILSRLQNSRVQQLKKLAQQCLR